MGKPLLPVVIATLLTLTASHAVALELSTIKYGVCLPEAAVAAAEKLTEKFPKRGPYRPGNDYSENDEITARRMEDDLGLRSFVPLGEGSEMITWSNSKTSISVTMGSKEKGCELLDVSIRDSQN